MVLAITLIIYNYNAICNAKYIGTSLNNSSIFYLKISTEELLKNGNLLYLYLLNWQVNAVMYDNLSSNLRL